MKNPETVAILSRGIQAIPYLNELMCCSASCFLRFGFSTQTFDWVAGWGSKANTRNARRLALQKNIPFVSIEDGFYRSIGLGVNKNPPLSLVLDDRGIYYDARSASRLEMILNNDFSKLPNLNAFSQLAAYHKTGKTPFGDPELVQRARQSIQQIKQFNLSKYNHAPDFDLGDKTRHRVLIVDQTFGDLSIEMGLADAQRFSEMLNTAINEHPNSEIMVKAHPDVVAGKKKGHFNRSNTPGSVKFVEQSINPISLIKQVDEVYVVTSQLGFEALLLEKKVHCFGAPFYAGWGLTRDKISIKRRSAKRSVIDLFIAACLLYTRYRDPLFGAPCALERVLSHLSLQRKQFFRLKPNSICIGMTPWKKKVVTPFLTTPWQCPKFAKKTSPMHNSRAPNEFHYILWGKKDNIDFSSTKLPVSRMEDGFLRSTGLGSDYTLPASLVLDHSGIYFDPGTPSDLELLLEFHNFSTEELARAKNIIQTINTYGLSKYNYGHKQPLEISPPAEKKVLLVIGQVESDASIQYGTFDIQTNSALIQEVRSKFPDEFILYKPHPDVESGNRRGKVNPDVEALCDYKIKHNSIDQCIGFSDEIHTMTSLTGFEALIQKKQVYTYGLPFYAGWGLTHDKYTCPRRSRKLSLAQLVAATLMLYPMYYSHQHHCFIKVEDLLEQMIKTSKNSTQTGLLSQNRLYRQMYKLSNIVRGMMNGQ